MKLRQNIPFSQNKAGRPRTSESDAERQDGCLYYAAAGKMAQAEQLVLEETFCVALSRVGKER